MRTKEINVPLDAMEDVADFIADHNLNNEILGSTEDGEIILSIEYEKEDRKVIFELMEIVEDSIKEEEEQSKNG
jgi:hypothetical protein